MIELDQSIIDLGNSLFSGVVFSKWENLCCLGGSTLFVVQHGQERETSLLGWAQLEGTFPRFYNGRFKRCG